MTKRRAPNISPGPSTLRVIEGAAHMPNLERPDEFNEALGAFLARVDA
ncbi:pimeloyl-ACP methyl ester carboxylesterase [Streptomyces sp. V4I8]